MKHIRYAHHPGKPTINDRLIGQLMHNAAMGDDEALASLEIIADNTRRAEALESDQRMVVTNPEKIAQAEEALAFVRSFRNGR